MKNGATPESTAEERKRNRRITAWAMGFTAVILVWVGFLLFTGNIRPEYGEDSVLIRASCWADLTIRYDDISSIEFRDENVSGSRVGGLGSFRLLGSFRNSEFGNYTRYTYTRCGACVVLTDRGKTVVLSGIDEEATRAICDELCRRTGPS